MSIIPHPHARPSTLPPTGGPAAAGSGAMAGPRLSPDAQEIDRFRALMLQREGGDRPDARLDALRAGRHAETAVARDRAYDDALKAESRERREDGRDSGAATLAGHVGDPAADAQRRESTTLPPAAAEQAAAPRIAELLDRHVRQLAASEGAAAGEGQVLLRMADATLPGTDLLLTRTPEGWALRADVRSRGSFDAIRDAAPELARRFAARNLGTLTVEPHLHE